MGEQADGLEVSMEGRHGGQLQECGWKGAFRGNTAVHYVKRTVLSGPHTC